MTQIFLETRMFRLSDGKEIMMLAFFVLIQYRSVTDGQTDGRTDIPPLAIPAVCIARYANALVKSKSETWIHQEEPERYTSRVEVSGLCCFCQVRYGICQHYMGSSLHQGQWCTGESPEEGCSLDHK